MQKSSFKGYKIEFTSQASKDLKKLDRREAEKIDKKLDDLIAGKSNVNIKKIVNEVVPTYRLRCDDYRIVFEVKREIITIIVVAVGHRREIYRDY